MEEEKKPKRPRIGASAAASANLSADGTTEAHYDKADYQGENKTHTTDGSQLQDRNYQPRQYSRPGGYQQRGYNQGGYGNRQQGGYNQGGYGNRQQGGYNRNYNPNYNNPYNRPYNNRAAQNTGAEGGEQTNAAEGATQNSAAQGEQQNFAPRQNRMNQGSYQQRQGGFNNRQQGGYQQRSFNPNFRQQNNRYNQGGYNQGGYGNRQQSGEGQQGGFQQRQQGGFQQRQQGGFNNRQQGGFGNRQQGGFGNRQQGGFGNRQQGGFQQRGNQQRQQGGFQQRGKQQQQRPGLRFTPRPKQIDYVLEDIDPNEPIRLNKFMANAGVCSRREADEHIAAGLVKINGEVVTELGTKISRTDVVEYNDQVVTPERKCYVLLNKPKDCVTTSDDPQGRMTVLDLVKNACKERIYPVGRLDRNTTGVLLLTNDGDLASKLTHPKFVKKKIYHVWTDKDITEDDMQSIADGIELEDGEIHADAISYVNDTDRNQAGIEIHSGKNRIVRRIFEHLGYRVTKLDRVYFAGLTKKNLPRGRWRYLTQEEVNYLRMGSFE